MRALLFLLLLLFLASCSSKKVATVATPSSANELVTRVMANKPADNVTARCSYSLTVGDKTLSPGGSLKMQRDKLIQLSITMLGIEVGRMEFTPEQITVVDRINKRYVQGEYGSVAFARDNNLDFRVLQALFYGELFSMGSDFTLSTTGDMGVLTTRNNTLTVNFVTTLATGQIRQTNMTGTRDMTKALNVQYFARQESQPTDFVLSFVGLKDKFSLGLSLSNVKMNTGATVAPTVIDPKYKKMDPQTAITSVLGM